MSGCADMVTRLLPPLFSSVSPGPGREVRNGLGWSLMEENSQVRGLVVPGCLGRGAVHFLAFAEFASWVQKGSFLTAWVVFLFILVWARHGCRATIWRAVMATA